MDKLFITCYAKIVRYIKLFFKPSSLKKTEFNLVCSSESLREYTFFINLALRRLWCVDSSQPTS